MGNVSILDCTLRDGGYINDWRFGKESIDFVLRKLDDSNIEFIEIGFIKDTDYDPDRAVYPDVETINSVIPQIPTRSSKYVGMIDMSKPLSLDKIPKHVEGGIDAIRVIFKQDKINEGYAYIKEIIDRGYQAMVQLVSTDTYTDDELVDVVRKFNELNPFAVYIVDSLGLLMKRDFMRMAYIMDHNLSPDIYLGYHSHNNLQQARQNAEALVELGLKRDIIIDASVFGMGRGAGNLNEELFADYLNSYYGKHYRIEPLLEIIDGCLNDIYKNNFWGYSLPFYLSAKNKVHPNYAKFYNEKGTLTEKAFDELLKTISPEDSHIYSSELANKYYVQYMERYVDDRNSIESLSQELKGKDILAIAPGENIRKQSDIIHDFIEKNNPTIISISFKPDDIDVDYIFCSNLRKYENIMNNTDKFLLTSNIQNIDDNVEYLFNYDTYLSKHELIVDNSGLMLIKILRECGIKRLYLAGMDGYVFSPTDNRITDQYISQAITNEKINNSMSEEIIELRNDIEIIFITPSQYD